MDAGLSIAPPIMSFSLDYEENKNENNNNLEVDALNDNQSVEEQVDVVLHSELVERVLHGNNIDEITDLYQQTLTALYRCESDNQSKARIIARYQTLDEEKDLLIESLGSTIHASNARIQTLTECRDVLRGRIETLTCEVQSCAQENTRLRTRVEELEQTSASHARNAIHLQERMTQLQMSRFNTAMQTIQYEMGKRNWFLERVAAISLGMNLANLTLYNKIFSKIEGHFTRTDEPYFTKAYERCDLSKICKQVFLKLKNVTMSKHFRLHQPEGVQIGIKQYHEIKSILKAYTGKEDGWSREDWDIFQNIILRIIYLSSIGFDSLKPLEEGIWEGAIKGKIYHIYPRGAHLSQEHAIYTA